MKAALLRSKAAAIYLTIFCSWIVTPVTQGQDASFGSDRFFMTTITRNEKPLLAEALFNDTEGNTIVLGAPLIAVISKAYDLPRYKILNGPEWIYTPRLYDIEAIPPPAFIDSSETLMLQNLLKDRFSFEATFTTREMPGLALEFGAGDLNLEPISDNTETGLKMTRLTVSNVSVTFTLDDLAASATKALNQPVINRTGLPGRYKIELDLSDPAGFPTTSKFYSTNLITPIIQGSGLRVQEISVPTDVLVIDKVDHPVLSN